MSTVLRRRFKEHKDNAGRRRIPFRLTYEQWLGIWQASGHLNARGKGSGRYHMARYGDQGAYEVGNVHIVTHNDNSSSVVMSLEARSKMGAPHKGVPKSKEQRERMAKANTGHIHSEATRKKMSASAKNRRKNYG